MNFLMEANSAGHCGGKNNQENKKKQLMEELRRICTMKWPPGGSGNIEVVLMCSFSIRLIAMTSEKTLLCQGESPLLHRLYYVVKLLDY